MKALCRIGDILLRVKDQVEIQDLEFYKRLTIRINHQGVSVRDTEMGVNIGTKAQFRVRAGDFILSKIDARQGAFGIIPPEADGGIITGNFWTYRVNNQLLNTEWFLHFTNSNDFLDLCQRSSTGNTHRKYLNESIFLNHKISVPSLEEQQKTVDAYNIGRSRVNSIQIEITRQQSLLAKLKQAILQDAIQGKLTAGWRAAHPCVEPASQLLHRIQTEKTRLIAAKILRKEKPLPKIPLDEIPFEIPSGWGWCRLDDFLNVRAGIAKGGKHYTGSTTPTPYLRVANVQRGYLDLAEIKYLDLPASEVKKYALEDGDLLVTEGGDPDKVGRCAVWRNEVEGCVHQNHIFSLRPFVDLSLKLDFVPLLLNSPFCQTHFLGSYKQTTNLASINKTVLRSTPVPLPPLAEQKAIVEKVDALMTTCRALEAEIEHSRTHAAHLLQAVLREAFSGQPVAQDANDKPAPATAKVIPFSIKIPNISATDLHAGILARAYQQHEHSPKHLVHFGHVKAEKIAHMVEAHLGIDLERVPVKAAAGPNDYPHLKKVESRAKKANWFLVRQQQADGAYVFHKEHGFDALLGKTAEALGEHAAEVDALINLLLPLNTRQAEIVATLYAAWNNLLLLGLSPNDEDIVYEARENWHASKLGIEREKFFKGLEWMRKQGLVPTGRGRYVDTK